MTVHKAYPLSWPQNWPRTKSPVNSQFKTTLPSAINNVQDSLRKFSKDSDKNVENFMVSSNVTLMDQRPKDSGVAVYFTWDGIATCIAVDRYEKVEENLQAIHHCIEAERTKLRHGGLNLVRAAFRGYAALPPPSSSNRDPYAVLGLKKGASLADVEAKYRELARKKHPDSGGSEKEMQELNEARSRLKAELGA